MKILFLFLDAVRGNLSSLKNPAIKETLLEKFQKDIGGTYYTNAHTIIPNTFQSLNVIRTGLIPKKNGCIYRRSMSYLNKEFELFNYLIEKKVNIYILTSPHFEAMGTFKIKGVKKYYDIKNLLKDYQEDNSIDKMIFFYCFDYHELVVKENTIQKEKIARNKLGNMLNNIFQKIEQEFDKVILFSDHGFTLENEKDFFSLEDYKTNVLLQIRENIEERKNLKIKNNLVSLLDIFPTVISWFEDEKKYSLDGFALKDETTKRKLYLEDGISDDYGNYFSLKRLLKNYRIAKITDNGKKIFKFEEIIKIKTTNLFKEFEENLEHMKRNIQLYEVCYETKKYLNTNRIFEDEVIDKNSNIYKTINNNIKKIYYVDGSIISKKDYYNEFKGKNKIKNLIKRKLKNILENFGCFFS